MLFISYQFLCTWFPLTRMLIFAVNTPISPYLSLLNTHTHTHTDTPSWSSSSITVSYLVFLLLIIVYSVSTSPAGLWRPRGQMGSNTDEGTVTMEFLAVPSTPLGGFGSSDLASVKWLCWSSMSISLSDSQERSTFCFLSFVCAHSDIFCQCPERK